MICSIAELEGDRIHSHELLTFFVKGTDLEQIQQHLLKEMMSNPSGKIGTVEDVAHLVTLLSSPLASQGSWNFRD